MRTFCRQLPKLTFGILCFSLLTSCSVNRQEGTNSGGKGQDACAYYTREEFTHLMEERVSTLPQDVYSTEYQTIVRDVMNELKEKETYSISHPLMVYNPYGTNGCGLYLYLGIPDEKVTIVYTVHVEDEEIQDFTDTAYINRTTNHVTQAQVIGLVPGRQNQLTLEVKTTKGERLLKKTYVLDVVKMQNNIPIQMHVTPGTVSERTLGITGLFFQDGEKSYYTFYDNNGTLRAVIPARTLNPRAKIIQAGNKILCEYDSNQFALLDSNGFVVEQIHWGEDGVLTEYAYDGEHKRLLFLCEEIEDHTKNQVLSYDMRSQEWKTLFRFSKLFRGIDVKNLSVSGMQLIDNHDLIFTSTPFNMVFRINNIYDEPVIRWILGNEEQWQGTFCEDLLLAGGRKSLRFNQIQDAYYYKENGQKTGEYHLSLPEASQEEVENSALYLLKVNENMNQYRVEKEIPFEKQEVEFRAVVYGKHCMLHLMGLRQLREYTQKGEAVLISDTKSESFSPMIYKYAMDRYWFQ